MDSNLEAFLEKQYGGSTKKSAPKPAKKEKSAKPPAAQTAAKKSSKTEEPKLPVPEPVARMTDIGPQESTIYQPLEVVKGSVAVGATVPREAANG